MIDYEEVFPVVCSKCKRVIKHIAYGNTCIDDPDPKYGYYKQYDCKICNPKTGGNMQHGRLD